MLIYLIREFSLNLSWLNPHSSKIIKFFVNIGLFIPRDFSGFSVSFYQSHIFSKKECTELLDHSPNMYRKNLRLHYCGKAAYIFLSHNYLSLKSIDKLSPRLLLDRNFLYIILFFHDLNYYIEICLFEIHWFYLSFN